MRAFASGRDRDVARGAHRVNKATRSRRTKEKEKNKRRKEESLGAVTRTALTTSYIHASMASSSSHATPKSARTVSVFSRAHLLSPLAGTGAIATLGTARPSGVGPSRRNVLASRRGASERAARAIQNIARCAHRPREAGRGRRRRRRPRRSRQHAPYATETKTHRRRQVNPMHGGGPARRGGDAGSRGATGPLDVASTRSCAAYVDATHAYVRPDLELSRQAPRRKKFKYPEKVITISKMLRTEIRYLEKS